MYKFSRNLMILLGASFCNSVVAFLFTAYATHKLTLEDFGKFSTIQIFVSSLAVVTELGITQVIIREVAQNKTKASYIAGNVLALKTVLGILGATVTILVAYYLQYDLSTRMLISVYSLSLIASSVSNAAIAIFSGYENMLFATVITWGTTLGNILGIVLLFFEYKLLHLLGLMVISTGCATIVCIFLLNRFYSVHNLFIVDIALWKKYFITGLPFGIMAILGSVGVSTGPVMLSLIVGEVEVGYFNAIMKIINILNLVIMAYNSAIYPVFNRLFADSPNKLRKSYNMSLKLAISFGLPVAFGLTVLANKIMLVTFPRYAFATPGLQILIWFWFFSLLATPVLNVLYAEKRESDAVIVMLISVVTCLIFNLLLIPNFDFIGVCVALVCLTAAQFFIAYYKIVKSYKTEWISKVCIKSLAISFVVAGLGIISYTLNLLFIIFCMGFIWIMLFGFFKILDNDEWSALIEFPVLNRLSSIVSSNCRNN